ncbi:carbohydrate-binding module family 32 protein [Patellaria atrata CBS 101060]|uniref:alpha,alpha-trehalase n=1 Tax=Patellaria atrata CBS 101060 TaxID=1346257 RepID=A0A9P4SJ86_9PEZI|nr:carbohydrate-binding module family 32 protein [Patellaria atrata CBS 101060]
MRTSLALSFATLLFNACFADGKTYETRFEGVTWDDDKWRIKTTKFDQGRFQSRMSLANGYLGINVAAVGPFFDVDEIGTFDGTAGWPLFNQRQSFATISGFWNLQPKVKMTNFEWLDQYGGESVISGVPHWAGLVVKVGNKILDANVHASQITDFSSTLDIAAGLLSWSYIWIPEDQTAIEIEYSMFVNKLYINRAALQLKLRASRDVDVTVIDVLDGNCAVRSDPVGTGYESETPTIWSAVSPNGLSDVKAYIYSTLVLGPDVNISTRSELIDAPYLSRDPSTVAQSIVVGLKEGRSSVIEKFIGGASTDAFQDPQNVASKAAAEGASAGFDAELREHSQEWASIMTGNTVDDYSISETGLLPEDENIVELQITAVTNPFSLLQQIIGVNAIEKANGNTLLDTNSITVCGLGSDCYAGYIFWDTEVWMAPGLVVAYPQAGKQIANYRVQRYPQAKENIKTAYQSSKNNTGRYSENSAAFPWTSGRFGNCTGTGPCFDYEYHLNGDIGLEFLNYYYVTGDVDFFRDELFPIFDSIASFFVETLDYNETSGKYDLANATDPDEYANHIDNPGFTMPLIQSHLTTANDLRAKFGKPRVTEWLEISEKINIPVHEPADIILEYATMDGSISVKQADVVLIDDFLDWPNSYTLSNLKYYAGKQSEYGPGMTFGVFSVVENAIAPAGCASYTYDLYASKPYIRAPWFQYSEQLLDDFETNGGTLTAFPFLTGMGGANRVAVFGYLGLKLMIDSFHINPSLPPQIPRINYRTIYWQGHAIDAVSNYTHTTLVRLDMSLETANSEYANFPIPVTVGRENTRYQLRAGETLTIPNRQVGSKTSVSGNIAQCLPASSRQDTLPGQFPLAAIDGAISTKWQPVSANITSSMTVDLSSVPFQPVIGFSFDWAESPPESFFITFSNESTAFDALEVFSLNDVEISKPYVAAEADLIVAYQSNGTNITLETPVWTGKYATLHIRGNQAHTDTNGVGATVAEWAIIGKSGQSVLESSAQSIYRSLLGRWFMT